VRDAAQIRLDIGATAQEIEEHDAKGDELRKRLGRALAEARDHPELTLEEGRCIPEKEITRQKANRLIREAALERESAENAALEKETELWKGP
jgi:hypothetical protein